MNTINTDICLSPQEICSDLAYLMSKGQPYNESGFQEMLSKVKYDRDAISLEMIKQEMLRCDFSITKNRYIYRGPDYMATLPPSENATPQQVVMNKMKEGRK